MGHIREHSQPSSNLIAPRPSRDHKPSAPLQRLPIASDCGEGGRLVDEAGQQRQVEPRQHLALLHRDIALAAQAVGLDAALAPVPDLGDAEFAIDIELIDAPGGPDHFDGQVRTLGIFGAKDVALVWLRTAGAILGLQGPGAVGRKRDIALQTVGLDQGADDGLDALVGLRWTHDLDVSLQIGDARCGVVAAHIKQSLVFLPTDAGQEDDVVLDGTIVALFILGLCVHLGVVSVDSGSI